MYNIYLGIVLLLLSMLIIINNKADAKIILRGDPSPYYASCKDVYLESFNGINIEHSYQDPVIRCSTYSYIISTLETSRGDAGVGVTKNNLYGIVKQGTYATYVSKKDSMRDFAYYYYKNHINKNSYSFTTVWKGSYSLEYDKNISSSFCDIYNYYKESNGERNWICNF